MATLEFLIAAMVSTWRFQSDSGKNCTSPDPHITAKAPSSRSTSGGLALASRSRHAVLPPGKRVSPLLHQSFWPYPCSPAVTAPAKELMALLQSTSLEYLAGTPEYSPKS